MDVCEIQFQSSIEEVENHHTLLWDIYDFDFRRGFKAWNEYGMRHNGAIVETLEKENVWIDSLNTAGMFSEPAYRYFKERIRWSLKKRKEFGYNGSLGEAIADMALSQADNSTLRYFSISRQINKEKRKYNDTLERCQKGSCDITVWIEWYLDCMLRSIEGAEEMLSSILNKAIFWQNHSQAILNDRQKNVLNIYLDGYIGKQTTKKWAKLAKTSPDTAARDIKQLTEAGILVPQEGKFRNVPYSIVISKDLILTPCPEDEEE